MKLMVLAPKELGIPNKVMWNLASSYLTLGPPNRSRQKRDAIQALSVGNIQPLISFIETHFYPILSTRDAKDSNEFSLKLILLSYLVDLHEYELASEKETDHGFIDISAIILHEPRKRDPTHQLKDIVLELKRYHLKNLRWFDGKKYDEIDGAFLREQTVEDLVKHIRVKTDKRLQELEELVMDAQAQGLRYCMVIFQKGVILISSGFEGHP